MGSRITRDHHNLNRTLKLNGHYISNDGDAEGIRVTDAGVVTMSSQLDIGNMSLTTSELDISSGDFTLDVAGDINLDAGTNVNIPADKGLTFGDDGEKIQGDGTDLTISSSRYITLDSNSAQIFDANGGIFQFRDNGDADDLFKVTVAEGTGASI